MCEVVVTCVSSVSFTKLYHVHRPMGVNATFCVCTWLYSCGNHFRHSLHTQSLYTFHTELYSYCKERLLMGNVVYLYKNILATISQKKKK